MTVFYFTATGNSLAVAKQIGGALISIPQVIYANSQHFKDDVIGVVFPIYWWSPPIMVRRFLENARFEAVFIFAIGTYGGISGGAMASLPDYAKKNGYSFDYINQVLMLDNYLPVYDIAAQEKKLPKRRVGENIAKIVSDISGRKPMKAKSQPIRRLMTSSMGGKFKPENNALEYIVDDKCNNCGICAKVCPSNNIAVADEVVFCDRCEGCLACVHHCPQNAIHLKNEKSAKRWRNLEVSLDEIIEANNRIK